MRCRDRQTGFAVLRISRCQRALSSPSFTALLCAAACFSSGARGKRVALVIGNNDYGDVSKLEKNVTDDARAIPTTLRRLGFDVITALDVNRARYVTRAGGFRIPRPAGRHGTCSISPDTALRMEGGNISAKPTSPT